MAAVAADVGSLGSLGSGELRYTVPGPDEKALARSHSAHVQAPVSAICGRGLRLEGFVPGELWLSFKDYSEGRHLCARAAAAVTVHRLPFGRGVAQLLARESRRSTSEP